LGRKIFFPLFFFVFVFFAFFRPYCELKLTTWSIPPLPLPPPHLLIIPSSYGTSAEAVAAVSKLNRRCILDIDTQGVKLIKSNHPSLNPVFLFLSPPSISALRSRLSGRGTETQESLDARLGAAKDEIRYAVEGGHDVVIVNDDVERAYGLLESVAMGEEIEGDKLPEFGEEL
jgi:guanylate kinase